MSSASRAVRVGLWSAVLLWAGVIFGASSIPHGAAPLPGPGYDKLVHAGVYLGLGGLVALALRADGRARLTAVAVAIATGITYGALDEVHQGFVDGRTSSLADLGADTIGATLGALLAGAPGLARPTELDPRTETA